MTSVMKDRNGETIAIGDKICYPVRKGSSMWMEQGTITRFRDDYGANRFYSYEGQPAIVVRRDDDKMVNITNFENITKMPHSYGRTACVLLATGHHEYFEGVDSFETGSAGYIRLMTEDGDIIALMPKEAVQIVGIVKVGD
jgi:hypothetical protein